MRITGQSNGKRSFLLGVAFACAASACFGYLYLKDLGANMRLRPVEELNSWLATGQRRAHPVGTPDAQAAFLALLEKNGFSPGSTGRSELILRLQLWLGNQVTKVGPYDGPARGYDLLQHGLQGGGLLCGHMSDILREALVLLGVPARSVQLYESGFTHVVVEAFVEGRWRVFDPTFNVTYEGNGQVLGVSDIQERLQKLGPEGVHAVFHGKRLYPADLEQDARGWRQVFANAYVYELGEVPERWRRLPPWRYWTGPAFYYFGDHLMLFPAEHNHLYFFVTVVLPVVSILVALIALLLSESARRVTR